MDAAAEPPQIRPHLRDSVALLRDRNFTYLFIAYLVAFFGGSMVPIAMAFGVLQLTGSTSDTGLVIASQIAGTLAVVLFGGVVADRQSRRHLIVGADLAGALGQAGMAIVLASGHGNIPLLMGLMAWNGVAGAFVHPAQVGFVPQVVAPQQLHAANALLATARSAALSLGAAIGGVLVALVGSGATIAVDAVGLTIAALLVSRIRVGARPPEPTTSLLGDLRGGWIEFTSHRWLWVIVLQFSLLVAASESVYGLIGPAVSKVAMNGAADWGVVMAAFGAGTLLGGIVILRIHVVRPMLFGTNCMFAAAVPSLMLAVWPRVWPVAVATFANGFCGQMFGVLWNTTLQRKIPSTMLSRVSAYDALGSIGLAPLGIVAAGFLLEAAGATTTLVVAAAMIAGPTALALLEPDVRRLRLDS
ncbi:MAG TPA: MFS transporter [Pseudomonadales bacterium]|nr:MFS transporter [Pseudomonadales bacterium]